MIKYNPNKSFDKQTNAVQTYIRQQVIDIQAQPASHDALGRPATYNFEFTDSMQTAYNVLVENVYISNASWALKDQRITVTPKQ